MTSGNQDVPGGGPSLPAARGALTDYLFGQLREPVHPLGAGPAIADDPASGDDFHLALYACYELHYRGFATVDERWEWEPTLLAFRRRLESAFEAALAVLVAAPAPTDVPRQLAELADGDGPSLSRHMEESGTRRQFEEFAIHRSAYQLKEADPHTWGIPRLAGGPKSAMVEIQADEYGGGAPGESHAELFAATLTGLGLDPSYGAYVGLLPGSTLATVNLVSLFGLHRRWRG
ncbi:MAG: iron-containing redox enzyme family protein, partial [Actinomycetota bacterium]|nr:iron-containing redox enzyme family protein [Actinomycetota bacterium]